MTREIKFRFRDEPTKKEVFECRNGGIYITATGCPISIHNHGHADYEDFIVEQYTGLTDKNGIEIYEGDVVQCALGAKYKVVFSDEWCAFMLIENKTGRQVIIYPEMKLEVIGNIYENPELLESK